MNSEILNIEDIDFSISIDSLIESNIIPPKFRMCTFDNYYPDKNYPSQEEIKRKLNTFVKQMEDFKKIKRKPKLLRKISKVKKPKNIYLDGIFGVGKTHLLAAIGNECKYNSAFLSFSELVYLIAFYRLKDVVMELSDKFDIVLIDEFELDDPGDAMMGINFIREMNKTECVVAATSNTIPSQLGERKLDILVFKERIGKLVNSFDTIIIDGKDYRIRQKKIEFNSTNKSIESIFKSYKPKNRKKLIVDFEKLVEKLREVHPFRYTQLSYDLDALFIKNLRPFSKDELMDTLRFSHMIDTLYYGDVEIFANGECSIFDLFHPDLKDGKFKTKIGRCLSRLSEKCTLIKQNQVYLEAFQQQNLQNTYSRLTYL